jgi:hypothetical protein
MHESGLFGWIPKRPKGPDCKSGGTAFAGSNPAPPMSVSIGMERIGIRRRWGVSQPAARHRTNREENHPEGWRSARRALHSVLVGLPGIVADQGYPRRESWLDADKNCGCNSMVEYLPSKQATWVRFPSPAFWERSQPGRSVENRALHREENRALHRENVNRGFDLTSWNAANANHLRRVLLLADMAGRGCRGSVGRARPW